MQVNRSTNVLQLNIKLTQTSPAPASVVGKCSTIPSDHYIVGATYAILKLVRKAVILHRKNGKNWKQAGKTYKWQEDLYGQLTLILTVGSNHHIEVSSIHRSAFIRSTTKFYDKWLPYKKRRNKVACVNHNIVRILQDGLQIWVCVLQAKTFLAQGILATGWLNANERAFSRSAAVWTKIKTGQIPPNDRHIINKW